VLIFALLFCAKKCNQTTFCPLFHFHGFIFIFLLLHNYQPMKKFKTGIILFVVFEAIAVSLWLSTGQLFFLLTLPISALALRLGMYLW